MCLPQKANVFTYHPHKIPTRQSLTFARPVRMRDRKLIYNFTIKIEILLGHYHTKSDKIVAVKNQGIH